MESYLYVDPRQFQRLAEPNGKYIHWVDDLESDLPILMRTTGHGSELPLTYVEVFKRTFKESTKREALRVKRSGKWISWTYSQYYEDSVRFAKAMINLGIASKTCCNIIGFNSPEWVISYSGSIFANCIPVGVYTTNGPEACHYIAEHSLAELIVVQNEEHLRKYLLIWDRLPKLKAIVVYSPGNELNLLRQGKSIYTWEEFMALGASSDQQEIEVRMNSQTPSQCATIVYTSGTTGPPKGVMLSHDNFLWTVTTVLKNFGLFDSDQHQVSYLPLSHVVSQLLDIYGSIASGSTLHFADEKALQGTLGDTLREVRPTIFFGVPRVYEKIEEKIKSAAAKNGSIAKKIGAWAKSVGHSSTSLQLSGQSPSLHFKLARSLVFNKVKNLLGFDRCKAWITGAAPISQSTIDFFMSLNIPIFNNYGMSESSGPVTTMTVSYNNINSAGYGLPGTDIKIINLKGEEQPTGERGEICFRGRHKFLGYYKNAKATIETMDSNGFVHSGDEGYLDERGFLYITGRFKELIITAGGENVPPVLIENAIKDVCKLVSNAFVVGDFRKYLGCLISLKNELGSDGMPGDKLTPEVLGILKDIGSSATTIAEAVQDPLVRKFVDKAIEEVNSNATSRAQHIRKWIFLTKDFSIPGGELTPTMKVKRKFVNEKYSSEIEKLYHEPKL